MTILDDAGEFISDQHTLDPGSDERKAGKKASKQAVAEWDALLPAVPTYHQLWDAPGKYEGFGAGDTSLQDPTYIQKESDVTQSLGSVRQDSRDDIERIDPNRSQDIQGGILGKVGQLQSAGYYGNLAAGGPDAQAEAAYSRSVAEGEMQAKAQRDAAMQQAEMRGAAGSGAALMGDLSAGQGSAQNAYGAGMQRAADEQARRDYGAEQYTDLAGNMVDQGLDESQAQWDAWYSATGDNAAAHNTALSEDSAAYNQALSEDAAALQEAEQANQAAWNEAAYQDWSRGNQARDNNVLARNAAHQRNASIAQRQFDNERDVRAGTAAALQGQSGMYTAMGGEAFNPKELAGAAGDGIQAYYTGGAA